MSDEALIQKALDQITAHDAASARLKRWVNDADIMLGNEPRFSDIGEPHSPNQNGSSGPITAANSGVKRYTPGSFFNKPFAGAVKNIMTDRYEANGRQPSPASVDAIHEMLLEGSFNFETSGADAQKNSIRISLGKNSVTFVKLPNTDLFGLVEWYGKRLKPGRKPTTSGSQAPDATVGDAAIEEDDEGQDQSTVIDGVEATIA